MECFINEKGLERKAKLEDILPLLGISLQFILRDTFNYDYLPYAIAHLPDEMKNLVHTRHIIVLMEDHTYERSFIGTTETTLGRSQMPQ
jgi:hypothetical protein